MPWFRCLARGDNFPGELAAHSGLVGFYVTRFVEAADTSEAESLVISQLRSEPKLAPPPNYQRRGIAQVVLEEIEEVLLEQVPSPQSGFIWYPMDAED